jgi:hypothetical protein
MILTKNIAALKAACLDISCVACLSFTLFLSSAQTRLLFHSVNFIAGAIAT